MDLSQQTELNTLLTIKYHYGILDFYIKLCNSFLLNNYYPLVKTGRLGFDKRGLKW